MLAHLPCTKLFTLICFVVPEEPDLSALVIHLVIWLLLRLVSLSDTGGLCTCVYRYSYVCSRWKVGKMCSPGLYMLLANAFKESITLDLR